MMFFGKKINRSDNSKPVRRPAVDQQRLAHLTADFAAAKENKAANQGANSSSDGTVSGTAGDIRQAMSNDVPASAGAAGNHAPKPDLSRNTVRITPEMLQLTASMTESVNGEQTSLVPSVANKGTLKEPSVDCRKESKPTAKSGSPFKLPKLSKIKKGNGQFLELSKISPDEMLNHHDVTADQANDCSTKAIHSSAKILPEKLLLELGGKKSARRREMLRQPHSATLTDNIKRVSCPSDLENAYSVSAMKSGWHRYAKLTLSWLKTLCLVLVIAFLFNSYVCRRNAISGVAMQPTLDDGEHVLVNLLAAHIGAIRRGDIIILDSGNLSEHIQVGDLVKRVVAVGGDTVELKDEAVYVNGEKLDEPYLASGTVTEPIDLRFKKVVLDKNQYYVLGDNRSASLDSRFFGPILRSDIVGECVLRTAPMHKFGRIR